MHFLGSIGGILKEHQTIVNIICGAVVIIFGLNYLEIINIKLFKGENNKQTEKKGIIGAFIFGMVFSINLTPCVGAFLGSALMMASVSGTLLKGISLLFVYSLGLGIPIIISAFLIKKLTSVFDFIKKHYKAINNICGIFLIIIGVAIMCGMTRGDFLKKTNNDILNNSNENKKEENKMLEVNVTKQNFEEEVLKTEKLVIVDFWANWCAPCKMLAPVLTEIAEEYKDKVKVCKVNIDEENELAIEYRITSIPTLIVFKDGKATKTLIGLRSKTELEEMLDLK